MRENRSCDEICSAFIASSFLPSPSLLLSFYAQSSGLFTSQSPKARNPEILTPTTSRLTNVIAKIQPASTGKSVNSVV